MRVLIIEDEADLSDVILKALRECGYSADAASDGHEGLFKSLATEYDVIILDLMLPGLHGYDLLRKLRETRKTPVLVLTARDAVEDRVRGLDLGADDYMVKPFSLDELIARLRALIRRSAGQPSPLLTVGDVELDTSARLVRRAGSPVEIAGKEFALLELLMLNRGKLVSRGTIYECIYGEQDNTLSNVVDVYVSNLRKKLGSDLIQTRRGEGYIIRD